MKKIIAILAAAAAMFACSKVEIPDPYTQDINNSEIVFNIDVAELEAATKGEYSKNGWEAGDRINIWFDGWNVTYNNPTPDLIITFNGTEWVAGKLSRNFIPKANGKLLGVYESYNDLTGNSNYLTYYDNGDQGDPISEVYCPVHSYQIDRNHQAHARAAVITFDNISYTFKDNLLTAHLTNYNWRNSLRVLIKTTNKAVKANAPNYCLKLKNETTGSCAMAYGIFSILPQTSSCPTFMNGSSNALGYTLGVAEDDGIAFYYYNFYATSANISFTLTKTNDETFEKSYTVSGKTINASDYNRCDNIILNMDKFQSYSIPGVFSVSEDKKVRFSKGNLIATIDSRGKPTAWKFAENQYDYLGKGGANPTIGTAAGDVDLFGLSTATTNYGISTSENYTDYSGDFVDWGKNIGDGSTWRTLSKDEWKYLFKTRANASSLYKCGVTICGNINCVVIAPDNSQRPILDSYSAGTWAAAEDNGFVCLPAAGFRHGSTVPDVGGYGYYWSSTAYDSSSAIRVFFDIGIVNPGGNFNRFNGYSVRLVTDIK